MDTWFHPDALDFLALANETLQSNTARQFLAAGGGILVVAFLVQLCRELWSHLSSGNANWSAPVVRVIIFAVLLGSYGAIVDGSLGVISQLGTFSGAAGRVEEIFYERLRTFNAAVARPDEPGFLDWDVSSFKVSLIELFTWLTFTFTLVVVYVLKHLQAFTLRVIIHLGPIALGLASIGGFFQTLGLSWFWALVEVGAWGVTMRILLHALDSVPISISDGAPQLTREITINVVYAALLMSVPAITSLVVRSHSATAIGNRGILATAAGIGILGKAAKNAPRAVLAGKRGLEKSAHLLAHGAKGDGSGSTAKGSAAKDGSGADSRATVSASSPRAGDGPAAGAASAPARQRSAGELGAIRGYYKKKRERGA